MNRKIIYVDFIFKRKKTTSKPLLFIYQIKINIKDFINKLFSKNINKKAHSSNSSNLYYFKKVL